MYKMCIFLVLMLSPFFINVAVAAHKTMRDNQTPPRAIDHPFMLLENVTSSEKLYAKPKQCARATGRDKSDISVNQANTDFNDAHKDELVLPADTHENFAKRLENELRLNLIKIEFMVLGRGWKRECLFPIIAVNENGQAMYILGIRTSNEDKVLSFWKDDPLVNWYDWSLKSNREVRGIFNIRLGDIDLIMNSAIR